MSQAMEECQKSGLTKNIGLSNFNCRQLSNILASCTIKPATLQIEVTPYFSNKRLVDFCKDKGILVTAYAPLGSPARPWREDGVPGPLDEPILKELGSENGKTVAQIILRYHMQNVIAVIPKSITPSRIQENIDVFDFELSDDEMKKVATLDKNLRGFQNERSKWSS